MKTIIPFVVLCCLFLCIMLLGGSVFACGLKVFHVAPVDSIPWADLALVFGAGCVFRYLAEVFTENL